MTSKKTGPDPERLKIDANWKDAMRRALESDSPKNHTDVDSDRTDHEQNKPNESSNG